MFVVLDGDSSVYLICLASLQDPGTKMFVLQSSWAYIGKNSFHVLSFKLLTLHPWMKLDIFSKDTKYLPLTNLPPYCPQRL